MRCAKKRSLNFINIILQRFIIQDMMERIEKGFKILTPKQMLQRLPTAFSQMKLGNTSGNLLNEIC